MDWMNFIFELLDRLIACMEDRRREAVENEMRKPGFPSRRCAHALLRKQGFRGRELRGEVDEAMEYLREQDDEDIKCLLDDAEQLLAERAAKAAKAGAPQPA